MQWLQFYTMLNIPVLFQQLCWESSKCHKRFGIKLTRDSVKDRVKEATNRTEKIEPIFEKWLKDVENVLAEVQMLEGRITEARKSLFRRQCRYFLAKEIARKTEK